MLSWIWVLIVGAIIGLIAGFITGKGGSMGFLANLIAGLVGFNLRPSNLWFVGAANGWDGNRTINIGSRHLGTSGFLCTRDA